MLQSLSYPVSPSAKSAQRIISVSTAPAAQWLPWQLNLFRFAFIYFGIQCVPLDWKYYANLFSYDYPIYYYGYIFNLARYYPKFIAGADTYLNWVIIALIAVAGTFILARFDKSKKEYHSLYYWLRVIVRYRLAAAVFAYGFIKLFPIQAPFPSISNLNTLYGDFTHWKVFSVSLGAAPLYEKFLGIVEILSALLLLNRRTATIGAFLIIAFAGNVFLSNFAYEGGEDIYSLYIVILASFLVVFDAERIWKLVSEHRAVAPNKFQPQFNRSLSRLRIALKGAFVLVFLFIYGGETYAGYQHNQHTIPSTAGLKDAAGIYDVKVFELDGKEIPYSPADPVRWKDVVFEKWATISIRSNRPVIMDTLTQEIIPRNDQEKLYESAGTSGRHFYSYFVDGEKLLVLNNKNTHYKGETMLLNIERPSPGTIILSGVNENNQRIKVTLERLNKQYLFPLGRKKPIKI